MARFLLRASILASKFSGPFSVQVQSTEGSQSLMNVTYIIALSVCVSAGQHESANCCLQYFGISQRLFCESEAQGQ